MDRPPGHRVSCARYLRGPAAAASPAFAASTAAGHATIDGSKAHDAVIRQVPVFRSGKRPLGPARPTVAAISTSIVEFALG